MIISKYKIKERSDIMKVGTHYNYVIRVGNEYVANDKANAFTDDFNEAHVFTYKKATTKAGMLRQRFLVKKDERASQIQLVIKYNNK